MRDFRSLKVWEISHKFTLDIYKITSKYPKDELYCLVSQMRRSSSSIPTNIAEGCGRHSDDDFAHFLQIAFGSANEIQYQLILSKDLNYITEEVQKQLDSQISEIKRMLVGLINKLRK